MASSSPDSSMLSSVLLCLTDVIWKPMLLAAGTGGSMCSPPATSAATAPPGDSPLPFSRTSPAVAEIGPEEHTGSATAVVGRRLLLDEHDVTTPPAGDDGRRSADETTWTETGTGSPREVEAGDTATGTISPREEVEVVDKETGTGSLRVEVEAGFAETGTGSPGEVEAGEIVAESPGEDVVTGEAAIGTESPGEVMTGELATETGNLGGGAVAGDLEIGAVAGDLEIGAVAGNLGVEVTAGNLEEVSVGTRLAVQLAATELGRVRVSSEVGHGSGIV